MSGSYDGAEISGTLPSNVPLNVRTIQSSARAIPLSSQKCQNGSTSSLEDVVDASPLRMARPSKSYKSSQEEMASYLSSPGVAKTLPSRQRLDHTRNQISFNSISSSESCPDGANTSLDTIDAVPLRIHRMPLLCENYIEQHQASVENLLSNRTPLTSLGKDDDAEENLVLEPTENDQLLSPLPSSSGKEFSGHDRTVKQAGMSNGKSSLYPPSYSQLLGNGMQYDGLLGRRGSGRRAPLQTDTAAPSTSTSSRKEKNEANVTEVDLTARRQPKPLLQDASTNYEESVQVARDQEPNKKPQQPAIISTPPRNYPSQECQTTKYPDSCCCDNTCLRLCYALFHWKTLCSRFSAWDIGLTMTSVGIFIFDVVTDLLLSLNYYEKIDGDKDYIFFFGLTLGFVIGPSVIVQIFSFFWVVHDYREKNQTVKERGKLEKMPVSAMDVIKLFLAFILHVLQMAVLFRYFRVLYYGFRSRYYEVNRNIKKSKRVEYRKHFDTLWKYEVHDINMLRLLESFLESAPQLVLQIYIMLMTKQTQLITVISCLGSLLALSSMMVSIQRAIRNSNPNKQQLSIPASVVMFCWRACTISSRVLAFALFLTIQPLSFLIFMLSHWVAASAWIAWKGTNFCLNNKPAEYFFDAICGLIHIFCFFNVHEEGEGQTSRSRFRMLIFYIVILAESSVLSILWYFFRPGGGGGRSPTVRELEGMWQRDKYNSAPGLLPFKQASVIQPSYALAMLVAVHGFFMLGMVFMFCYYAMLHPRRTSMTCCVSRPKNKRRRQSRESSTEEFGTKLVSAPAVIRDAHHRTCPQADAIQTEPGKTVPIASAPQPSQGYIMHVGSSHSLQRRQEARENLCRRRRISNMSETGESENSPSKSTWSQTIFNRGKRARKLYTRQYSKEKALDDVHPSGVELKEFSPRQTERFAAVVTPTHERISSTRSTNHGKARLETLDTPKSIKTSQKQSGPPTPSILIPPGSQGPIHARRSATLHALGSCTHESPARGHEVGNAPHSLNTSPVRHPEGVSRRGCAPHGVGSRGYSASMSCLVEERPLTYTTRRKKALNPGVSQPLTSTLQADEVMECMETSV